VDRKNSLRRVGIGAKGRNEEARGFVVDGAKDATICGMAERRRENQICTRSMTLPDTPPGGLNGKPTETGVSMRFFNVYTKSIAALGATLALAGCLTETEIQEKTVYVGGPDTALLNAEGQTLKLCFLGKFGTDTLKTGRKYRTAGGDSVRFEMAKFYVSEIALVDSTGKSHYLMGTHLVDMLDSASQARGYAIISVKAIPGTYRGVRFSVGVPFEENHRDAALQSAPLGMESQMFWSWNSGYIFHRIEGKVDSAGVPKTFFYHIGTDNSKLPVNLFSVEDTSTQITVAGHHKVSAQGALTKSAHDVETHVPISTDYKQLFGADSASSLRPSVNTGERGSHGMGPLANRVYANTQSIFTLNSATASSGHH
jgi:hypothetical protein